MELPKMSTTEPQAIRKKNRLMANKNFELFLLSLPVVIYLFIFKYLPMGGVILAFKNYNYADGILGSAWIGFKNFEFYFRSDAAFVTTFNTLFYNFSFIVIGAIVNAAVALILNEVKSKFAIKFYQTTMFFPHFLSWVVVAFILYGFLSPAYGILNQVMQYFGMETKNWYQYAPAWRSIIIFMGLWKGMGMSVLINYAVLIGIDKSYYEAASVDGASKLQMTFRISIPFLIPITVIQFILAIGKVFNSDFGMFYQLTQGSGALYSTTSVIDTYVFQMLMDSNEIGIGAAIGLYQSVVGLILIVLTNFIVKKIQPESALF